jgi:hypothetical protein
MDVHPGFFTHPGSRIQGGKGTMTIYLTNKGTYFSTIKEVGTRIRNEL